MNQLGVALAQTDTDTFLEKSKNHISIRTLSTYVIHCRLLSIWNKAQESFMIYRNH